MISDVFKSILLPYLNRDLASIWALFRVNKHYQNLLTQCWHQRWSDSIRREWQSPDRDSYKHIMGQFVPTYSANDNVPILIMSVYDCIFYTKLILNRGCTQCQTLRIRKITMAFSVRWCQECIKIGGIYDYLLLQDNEISAGCSVGIPYHEVTLWSKYHGTYVNKLYLCCDLHRLFVNDSVNPYPLLRQRLNDIERKLEERKVLVAEKRMQYQLERARKRMRSNISPDIPSIHQETRPISFVQPEIVVDDSAHKCRCVGHASSSFHPLQPLRKSHKQLILECVDREYSKHQQKLTRSECPFCNKKNLIGMVDHFRAKHMDLL